MEHGLRVEGWGSRPVSPRVLHVDGDRAFAEPLRMALRRRGFDVEGAVTAEQALARLESGCFELVLVEWKLPGAMDGLELAATVRAAHPSIGAVMLTSVRAALAARRALDRACDDFLVKPCRAADIAAHLRAVARRAAGSRGVQGSLQWGALELDLVRDIARVEGREVELQPMQHRLLAYLVSKAPRLVSCEELRQQVFRAAQAPGSTNIARQISVLRRRLGPAAGLIVTAAGSYGMAASVPPEAEAPRALPLASRPRLWPDDGGKWGEPTGGAAG